MVFDKSTCNDAAEYVSALCDGETIPPAAAQHIAACPECQARLSDYLALGVELRRNASLELGAAALPSRPWTLPQNRAAAWWRKGRGTMRIPRLAFAVLIAGIVVLASTLAVNKVRAHATGSVVLLAAAGPDGPLMDCPLSTVDPNQATCSWYGKAGSRLLAYKVNLLSRDGDRVRLAIRTRTWLSGENLSAFTRDRDPAAQLTQVWFEPGQSLKVKVPQVGTLTFTGNWIDHVPLLGELDPGPGELRFGRPLLLKDDAVVGDMASVIGGFFSMDDQDRAAAFYIPGQGRFLIAQVPMQGAVEAHVAMGRISFQEDGHSWEIVNGVPVSRADHLWVLHQANFGRSVTGQSGDHVSFGNPRLIQTEPGVWVPEEQPN